MQSGAQEKKWYTKKRYIIPLGVAAIFVFSSANSSATPTAQVQSDSVTQSAYQTLSDSSSRVSPVETNQQTSSSDDLSNSNYYSNTYGNEVHSPAYTEDGSVPSGASAQCGDGTYSFSQSRRGTCSHHGGVSRWIN